MELTRRGFLGTMIAAAVGAVAEFDTTKGLWLPQGIAPTVEAIAAAETTDWVHASGVVASADVEAALELSDLAAQYAKLLGERIAQTPALVLRGVVYELARLPMVEGGIRLDDHRKGTFEPHHKRTVNTTEGGHPGPRHMADATFESIRHRKLTTFVPITRELRPGVKLADTEIALATDPATGVSVRVLKYTAWNGGRNVDLVSWEVAAGTWVPGSRQGQRRHAQSWERFSGLPSRW